MDEIMKFDRYEGGALIVPVSKIDFITSSWKQIWTKEGEIVPPDEPDAIVDWVLDDDRIVVMAGGKEFAVRGTMDETWDRILAVSAGDEDLPWTVESNKPWAAERVLGDSVHWDKSSEE